MARLIIDESGDAVGGLHRYIIGAILLDGDDDRMDEVGSEIVALRSRTPGRSRPFHWLTEGVAMRTAVLELVGRLSAEAYVIVGSAIPAQHLEFARVSCLRELCREVRDKEFGSVVIESRERSSKVVGQNRRDYETMVDARHAGEIRRNVGYRWAPKSEPLVWLADAVAGAGLAAERGEMTWLTMLNETTRTTVIRLPKNA